MLVSPNALRWQGDPGHYEVYYLTLTDPGTGVGVWIRYTLLAPLRGAAATPGCSLWLLAMDPHAPERPLLARKTTLPLDSLQAAADPFRLQIGNAELTDHGMRGAFADVAWDLRWEPADRSYEHVHPLLRRLGAAQTVLVLPHAQLRVTGRLELGGRTIELDRVHGGQAHLWGSAHARRWAWCHAGDFTTPDGEPVTDTFVDAVSVLVRRLGREVGPSTPLVARIEGEDICSTAPHAVLRNDSRFALTGWRFEARAGKRKLIGEVDAERRLLAGVVYQDPDGEPAYCYNSETASMRLQVLDRARQTGGWRHRITLVCRGRAHFEYAQRSPVPGLDLVLP